MTDIKPIMVSIPLDVAEDALSCMGFVLEQYPYNDEQRAESIRYSEILAKAIKDAEHIANKG